MEGNGNSISGDVPQPVVPVESSVFTHSISTAKIMAALAQAQLKYDDLKASQVADAEKYSYRYADLAAVLAAVRPALNGQGIAVLQGVTMQRSASGSGLVVLVETRLAHQSGEWIATLLKLPSSETAPQKVGSLVTYLRRYGLLALSGVASEDDDGADAMPRSHKRQQAQEPREEPRSSRPVPPRGAGPRVPDVEPTPEPGDQPRERRDLGPSEFPSDKPKPTRKPKAEPKQSAPAAMDAALDQHKKAEPGPARVPAQESKPGISASERGLLFKVAREQQVTEGQVKKLIFALFGYTSTAQLAQRELHKTINAIENPSDHGVAFLDDDDVSYAPEHDLNALRPEVQ